nr:uncharacterized protein LOC127299907 [Lolium perenne]
MAAALKLVPASHFFLFQCTSNPTRSDPQPSDPVPTGPRPVSPPACSPPSVRQAPVRCSAFASSWIGSRSGVVRYDKFSGCSSTSFNRQAFPLYSCPCRSRSPILFCLLPHAILKLRSCHLSFPLVTSSSPYCHHHLLRLLFGYRVCPCES